MARLVQHGIQLDLPTGWEARIGRREPDPQPYARVLTDGPPRRETTGAVVHAANFALPRGMGDFGSGATDLMTARSLLVVLFEYDQSSAGAALFAHQGLPAIAPADFSPATVRRSRPGQSAVQRFFTAAGRPFCLYVVLGSHRRRVGTVPIVRDLLAGVRIGQIGPEGSADEPAPPHDLPPSAPRGAARPQ